MIRTPMMSSTNFFLCIIAAVLLAQSPASAKGGGGGGGGSGGSSGGGYYGGYSGGSGYYNYGYNNTAGRYSDEPKENMPGILFLLVFGFLGYYLFDCCINGVAKGHWSGKIAKARDEILQDAAEHSSDAVQPQPPFSTASFDSSYTDTTYFGRQTSEGILVLQGPEPHSRGRWTPFGTRHTNVACHSVSGSGTDVDGNFTIVTGLLSPRSGKCFWVEETRSRREGQKRQVIVSGTLAWLPGVQEGHFRGYWVAQNGESGFFTSFRIVPWSNNNNSNRNGRRTEVVSAISMPSVDAVPVDSDCESVVQIEAKAVDVLSQGYNVYNNEARRAAATTTRVESNSNDYEPIPDDEEGAIIHSPVQQTSLVVNVRMGYDDPVW